MFAEALSDFEGGDHALVVGELVSDLVWSFGSKPLVGPDVQI